MNRKWNKEPERKQGARNKEQELKKGTGTETTNKKLGLKQGSGTETTSKEQELKQGTGT
jgi:hypothetical protein